ncbi:hypothetical protein CRE_17587 [Caenorhabditis remanei]|uniref:F-box domain-containing protein n=1 Tax=Caenorhabditis remanei TaxID=31234 RepID=E3NF63_CAERE|nr:hypothetical protein CRE_17587 [Caenorhabditis remanei]
MTFLFALLLCWIISVFIQTIKSLFIPNIPLPPPSFPLLRVPYVPLRRIIDFMDPDALVSLSFCSQKSHSVIKTQRRTPFNGRLCVSEVYENNLSFRAFRNRDCVLVVRDFLFFHNSERINYVKMNGQDVPVQVHCSDGNLISYWHNTTDGLIEATNYVTNLFNIDVSEVRVFDAINVIEQMSRRQKKPLESVTALRIIASEEELIYILRDCQCSSQISIRSDAPSNFRFSNNFRRIDFLYILHGQWVTIDNLLTMDGIVISLGYSNLSDRDLNVFLKHWLAGGCPRLKYFKAGIHSVNILQVLAGLLDNAVFVQKSRNYTSPSGYTSILSDGYDIQRSDGVTATVHYHPPLTFVIAVWPEVSDNNN